MIGVSKNMHRILNPLGKDDSPIGGRKASLLKGVQNLYNIVHPLPLLQRCFLKLRSRLVQSVLTPFLNALFQIA